MKRLNKAFFGIVFISSLLFIYSIRKQDQDFPSDINQSCSRDDFITQYDLVSEAGTRKAKGPLKNLDIRLKENSNDKLNEYVSFFNSSLNSISNRRKKVIFCDPRFGGYGNRLYTFLSCFVLGILTDSLVILTAWEESQEFIDFPFNPFYSAKSSSSLDPEFEKHKIFTIFHAPYAWDIKKDLDSTINFNIPKNRARFKYGEYEALFMVLCANPNHYERLVYYNLVEHETVQRSIETMKNSSASLVEKNHNLFMIGFEVGANLLNKIVIPKPKIQAIIKDYVRREFVNRYIIGMQLRTFYLDVDRDSLRFINCALQIENEYLSANRNNAKPVKWFISSDSEDLLNRLVALYPNKILTAKGDILHVATSPEGYYRTLVDVDLLSKCDEMIHTGGSTFGFVAAMKSFRVPYFIDGKSLQMKCFRTRLGTSSQVPNCESVF